MVSLCQSGYIFASHVRSRPLAEYKPMLKEVEKILAEAGLDEDEMKMQGTRDIAQGVGAGQSRNRR